MLLGGATLGTRCDTSKHEGCVPQPARRPSYSTSPAQPRLSDTVFPPQLALLRVSYDMTAMTARQPTSPASRLS
jgi:hypothetical protein